MTPTRHRPKVRRRPNGGHWFECSCGLRKPTRDTRPLAARDRDQHIKSLPPVPADAACRYPRAHDRKPWEACASCVDQLELFAP